jgi:hypothetical protein
VRADSALRTGSWLIGAMGSLILVILRQGVFDLGGFRGQRPWTGLWTVGRAGRFWGSALGRGFLTLEVSGAAPLDGVFVVRELRWTALTSEAV